MKTTGLEPATPPAKEKSRFRCADRTLAHVAGQGPSVRHALAHGSHLDSDEVWTLCGLAMHAVSSHWRDSRWSRLSIATALLVDCAAGEARAFVVEPPDEDVSQLRQREL